MKKPRFLSKSGVYLITCLANLKFYIGSSKDLSIRFNGYNSHLALNKNLHPHLQAAWNKYGKEQFLFGVLEYCDPSIRIQREQYYLNRFRCYERHIGFNTSPTASCCEGIKKTEAQKQAISLRKKGTKDSEETKRKRYESLKEFNYAKRKEFTVISPTGEKIREKGISEFSSKHGLCSANFSAMLHGKIKSTLGWHLETYVENQPYKFRNPFGEIITIPFNMLTQFAQNNGLSHRAMHHIWDGNQKIHQGWTKAEA